MIANRKSSTKRTGTELPTSSCVAWSFMLFAQPIHQGPPLHATKATAPRRIYQARLADEVVSAREQASVPLSRRGSARRAGARCTSRCFQCLSPRAIQFDWGGKTGTTCADSNGTAPQQRPDHGERTDGLFAEQSRDKTNCDNRQDPDQSRTWDLRINRLSQSFGFLIVTPEAFRDSREFAVRKSLIAAVSLGNAEQYSVAIKWISATCLRTRIPLVPPTWYPSLWVRKAPADRAVAARRGCARRAGP